MTEAVELTQQPPQNNDELPQVTMTEAVELTQQPPQDNDELPQVTMTEAVELTQQPPQDNDELPQVTMTEAVELTQQPPQDNDELPQVTMTEAVELTQQPPEDNDELPQVTKTEAIELTQQSPENNENDNFYYISSDNDDNDDILFTVKNEDDLNEPKIIDFNNNFHESYYNIYNNNIDKYSKIYVNSLFKTFMNNYYYKQELKEVFNNYLDRPTPLYFAKNLSNLFDNVEIWIKREDLNPAGSFEMMNILGLILIAKKNNIKRVIAETMDGFYGIYVSTACAILKMKCDIFISSCCYDKYPYNIKKIKLLGGNIIKIEGTYSDSKKACQKEWVKYFDSLLYITNTANSIYGYNNIIGNECYEQTLTTDFIPDVIILNNYNDFYKKYAIFGDAKYYKMKEIRFITCDEDLTKISSSKIENINSEPNEIKDAVHLLIRCEGIFPKKKFSKTIYSALAMAKELSGKSKTHKILFHL